MSRTSISKQQFIKLGLAEQVIPRIEKRVISLGHSNIQDYLRWLIINDIEGLFYDPQNKLAKHLKGAKKFVRSGKGKIVSSPAEVEEDLSQI